MYDVNIVKPSSPKTSLSPESFIHWKEKSNLYQLINRHCDRPAYFWYGFKYIILDSLPEGNGVYSIAEMIDQGYADRVLRDFISGVINPQAWCDSN